MASLWNASRGIHSRYAAGSARIVAPKPSIRETRRVASTPAPFSDEFAATAREEALRLAARAVELRARGERWLERAGDLLREADRMEQRVRELDELLGRAPQLRLDLQTTNLQGQRIREEATRILLERRGLNRPIHYREWFELLENCGVSVAGKDPLATFLTQISRSPVVARNPDGPGMYELDPHGAYERARRAVVEATLAVSTARDSGETGALTAAEAQLVLARRTLEGVLDARITLLSDRIGSPS